MYDGFGCRYQAVNDGPDRSVITLNEQRLALLIILSDIVNQFVIADRRIQNPFLLWILLEGMALVEYFVEQYSCTDRGIQ